MSPPAGPPRVVLSLARDGRCIELGRVGDDVACDLDLVDGLLRFDVAARRLGWALRLSEVADDLRDLFDLVGLPDRCPDVGGG